jgi:uncharacterized protein
MRTTTQVILFLAVAFVVLGSISYYVYIRGLQSIPHSSSLRHPYTIVFWIVALSFMAGRMLESRIPHPLADLLIWMGSFWIAALIYFLIAIIGLDLLRLVNHFLPFFPSAVKQNYGQAKYITAATVITAVCTIVFAGHINSILPRVRQMDISIGKKAAGIKSLDIVMISDVHLGTIVGRARFDHIVDRMNSLKPDLVLLPGDILDEDLAPVIKQNLGESLRNIQSRLGVYAATGNHEFFGDVERSCPYLIEHGIVMLRDQSVKIADAFFLVGREDRSSPRFTGHPRKTLKELMEGVDKSCPVILMDHQPFKLEEAVNEGVDLQVSGHTHKGQLWPINYIVKSIYELPWGSKKIANTHFYVSQGVGTWGPPVRIGTSPEIIKIRLHFE